MDSSQPVPYPGRFLLLSRQGYQLGKATSFSQLHPISLFFKDQQPRSHKQRRKKRPRRLISVPCMRLAHSTTLRSSLFFFLLPLDPLLSPPSPTTNVLLPCSRPDLKASSVSLSHLSDPSPRRRQNNETRPGSAGLRLHKFHGYLSYCSHFSVWGTCSRPSIVIFVMRSLLSDRQKAYAW